MLAKAMAPAVADDEPGPQHGTIYLQWFYIFANKLICLQMY